jgi:single-stranded DNA-binding protein
VFGASPRSATDCSHLFATSWVVNVGYRDHRITYIGGLQENKLVLKRKATSQSVACFRRSSRFHVTYAFGNALSKTAERIVKGSLVYVQGELVTRDYDRTIKVPNGKKTIDHTIKQLVVELKADTIRILDRSKSNSDATDAPSDNEAPE